MNLDNIAYTALKAQAYIYDFAEQDLYDYVAKSPEYQHWVLNDDCHDGSDPVHYLCWLSPASRIAFIEGFKTESLK